MSYFICAKCQKEVVTPAKIVECLGCGKKRIHVCIDCRDSFAGCNKKCVKKARYFLMNWLNKKIVRT